MWRILQADEPDDYVFATGVGISVREFVTIAFDHAGLDWEKYVKFGMTTTADWKSTPSVGDATKAHVQLGWKPTVDGREPARLMVDADIEALNHAGSPGWIPFALILAYRDCAALVPALLGLRRTVTSDDVRGPSHDRS